MTAWRECVRCGACCRWRGYVRLGEGEADAIAALLRLSTEEFVARFTRLTDDRRGLSLIENDDGSCVFLDGPNECRIQSAKPAQCVGFPNTWNFPGFEKRCRSTTAKPARKS